MGAFLSGTFLVPRTHANPAGASVVAGTASISQNGSTLNIVNSNGTIINWQSFSIGAGETTNFLQPSALSAVLNRVIGSDLSTIYGTLHSNGKVFLINPNGILIGSSGIINTAGFIASTLDVDNSEFLANNGTLHFLGASAATVQNLGTITATGGDVFLIARHVQNSGTITASSGTAGLYASEQVTLTTGQPDAGTVLLSSTSFSNGDGIGVSNSGLIAAAKVELKATGNMYALAINNTGVIRATGTSVQNGIVRLVAIGGAIRNTGVITAENAGGTGGFIETSGQTVDISGTVLTGSGGVWLIDPDDVTIDDGDGSAPDVNVTTLENDLNDGGTVMVSTDNEGYNSGTIDLNAALIWTGTGTLQLVATGDINLNDTISGINGGLTLSSGGTISDSAPLNVGTFTLQNGNWVQNNPTLPSFHAINFILNGGTFLRVLGGDGTSGNPYQLTDVYGLQGVKGFLSSNFVLANDIDASGTANWNGGEGFVPIGTRGDDDDEGSLYYQGTFNGAGHTINGLTIDLPDTDYVGLFGAIETGTLVENIGLTNVNITGTYDVGALVGASDGGTVQASYSTGMVSGGGDSNLFIGGLVGFTGGSLTTSYSTATVSGGYAVGGLVGQNIGNVTNSFSNGSVSGNNSVGGLVGLNDGGAVTISYSAGSVSGASDVGGLIGQNSASDSDLYWIDVAGQSLQHGGTLNPIGTDSGTSTRVTVLTAAQGSNSSNYDSAWDFTPGTGVWFIDSSINQGLPYLQGIAYSASTQTQTQTQTQTISVDSLTLSSIQNQTTGNFLAQDNLQNVDAAGDPAGQVQTGDDGDTNGHKKSSTLGFQNGSNNAPGQETVVGPGTTTAIGLHGVLMNVPPPPVLDKALSPMIKSELEQALHP